MFVGNIPYSSNEKKVKEHMSQAGEVHSVELFLDEVGVSRGCGIIEYTNSNDAINAIQILHHSKIDGRIITVKEDDSHSHSRRRLGSNYLKLRNLPLAVTGAQLKDLGTLFGSVVKADIVIDGAGRSRGAGLIVFEKAEDAMTAFSKLNKAIFNDKEVIAFVDGFDNKPNEQGSFTS